MEVVPATVTTPEADLLIEAVRVLIEGMGWSMTVGEPWVHLAPPVHVLPDQGWKLHVSATEDSAGDVLAAVVPVLLAERAAFKFAAGLRYVRVLNSAGADRASSGKFLTVYPTDDDQARRIAADAHAATAGLAGPVILSDRPYRPGSLVHYRYGGFTGRYAIDGDGLVVHLLRTPDGEPVPDERKPGYSAPAWAVDPFQPPPEPAGVAVAPPGPARVLLNERYLVTGVLAQANKGGTYLATDHHTGATVVVKEGRPHVATTTGGDARHAIRHEARMLELAAPLGRTPRLVDVFDQGGHSFLVEEHIDAAGLRDLVDPAYEPPGTGLPASSVRALAVAMADAVAAFHAAGVVLRDLTPNNVLVTDQGGIVLVDLELAHPAGEAPPAPAGTPGYAAPGQLAGEPSGFPDDYWSLGATIAYLATGADPYLPAGASHGWTDPARLAAWLVDHVASR
ncbi:MAG: protein kinase domain-containing protein, partial [Acidimicrobiia bacterium]